MRKNDKLKLEFESKSVNESFARAAVAAFAVRLDPDLEALNDIKTAVSEAVTNCIVHAYPDKIGLIYITVRVFESSIEIKVKDNGVGIPDITKAKEPMFTTGGSDRSGMGFTVMESLMDLVKIKSSEVSGTSITMCKKLKQRK